MENSPVSRCQRSSDLLLIAYPNFVRNVGKKTFEKIGVSREVCVVQFGKREICHNSSKVIIFFKENFVHLLI